jgi:hypothetical protein
LFIVLKPEVDLLPVKFFVLSGLAVHSATIAVVVYVLSGAAGLALILLCLAISWWLAT